jgi:zinc finger SWIM domain-containing protein 3
MTFESEEDAYEMYNTYAGKVGFSVRRSDTKRRADKTKQLVCSKRGFGSTRTGCNASIQFGVSREGVWTVQKIISGHNHYLASPNKKCKLRSQRHIIEADGLLIA